MNYCNKCGAAIVNSGHVCRIPNKKTEEAIREARELAGNPCFNIDCYFHTFSNQCAQISSEDGPAFCPKRIMRIDTDFSVIRAYKTNDGNIFEKEDDAKQYLLSNRIFKVQELDSDFEKWFADNGYKFFKKEINNSSILSTWASVVMAWLISNSDDLVEFINRINALREDKN
jgi:hypothetical protein